MEKDKLKINILSWLIHHANRTSKSQHYYLIKKKLLSKYGKFICHDVQFISGKECYSCDGLGNYIYDNGDVVDCYNCFNGWYKRPVWNILEKLQFGKYTFHQPFERSYSKPPVSLNIINGYISHNSSKHGKLALTILFLMYEKGYLKRWYKNIGIGFRLKWYYPSNWINNIIYFKKHNELPF